MGACFRCFYGDQPPPPGRSSGGTKVADTETAAQRGFPGAQHASAVALETGRRRGLRCQSTDHAAVRAGRGWRWCTAMERGKASCGWIPRSASTPSGPGRRPSPQTTDAARRGACKWGGGADPTPALAFPFCPAPEPGSQVEGGDSLIGCPLHPTPPRALGSPAPGRIVTNK